MTPSSDTAPAASDIVELIDAGILGLNRLTGYGEDAVWRPADNARSALIAAREEIERLRERLGPLGLEVVEIDGAGHYVNAKVRAEIERLRALPSTAEAPAWRDAMAKLIEASENIANQLERIGDYRKDRFFIQDVRDAIQDIRTLTLPKEQEG